MPSQKVEFYNDREYLLKGRVELPMKKKPYPFAIFAHVFTGNKNLLAARHISRALNQEGIAVLRFDFTGLGESEGNFSETNFSTNLNDIRSAVKFLEENFKEPEIIIGHSLGGAAALFSAAELDCIKAVATIGAPFQPEHVKNLFEDSIEEIKRKGAAIISVDNRLFSIKRQFLEDISARDTNEMIKNFRKALLILHSPQDEVVGIENAAKIYHAARHPKSFVTLDGANHMLNNKQDAKYVGQLIASWAMRYITRYEKERLYTHKQVMARLEEPGYTTEILAGKHNFLADEPEEVGGNDFGPSPYEFLNASLGACTAMTLQMYARRKKWPLEEVKVHLTISNDYMEDCKQCEDPKRKIYHFERAIELIGDLTEDQETRILKIADKCPVHKTLEGEISFNTYLYDKEK